MINLPKLEDLDVIGKTVLVRMDFDVPEGDLTRIETSKETLEYLLAHNAKLILIGHKGRPKLADSLQSTDYSLDKELSLRNLTEPLERMLGKEIYFVEDFKTFDFAPGEIFLLENLRFDEREEANDEGFAKELASLADFYVNEAFAVSHRAHASIVGVPQQFKIKYKQSLANYAGKNSVAAGMRFQKEIEHLNRVIENPDRPLIFLISGIKKDKLEMIENIKKLSDKVLVAGRLPEFLREDYHDDKVLVAKLNPDKEDITIRSIEKFEEEIAKAKTVVLAGVIGKYEDDGHRLGTKKVFEAVANANAYKVAGGGNTEAALTMFNLTDKFNWISVGGGAMLEFLAKGTLPGIDALLS